MGGPSELAVRTQSAPVALGFQPVSKAIVSGCDLTFERRKDPRSPMTDHTAQPAEYIRCESGQETRAAAPLLPDVYI